MFEESEIEKHEEVPDFMLLQISESSVFGGFMVHHKTTLPIF